jgi:hypothetical protein
MNPALTPTLYASAPGGVLTLQLGLLTWGLSTGPKTAKGIERIRRAKTKHGLYSAAAIAERQRFRAMFKSCREVLFAAKRVFWEKDQYSCRTRQLALPGAEFT